MKNLGLLAIFCWICVAGCAALKKGDKQIEQVVVDQICDPADAKRAQQLLVASQNAYIAGKIGLAEKKLNEAIRLNPELGPAHNNLGLVYFARRQLYEAAHEFDQATILMPASGLPHNNLGMVLEKGGRLDEAIVHYEQAFAMEPRQAEYLGNLARAKLIREDPPEEVGSLLKELVMLDSRPEWVEWANDELALGSLANCEPCKEVSDGNVPEQPATNEALDSEPIELSLPENVLLEPVVPEVL